MSRSSTARQSPTVRRGTSLAAAGNVLLAASALGASPQSMQLQRQLNELVGYYALPASMVRDRRRERFRSLAQRWKSETALLSSTSEIAMNSSYQAIIGMGPDALPLILEDLREHSGHWYWALKAISNEDPVPPSDRGVIKQMRGAWLRWGAKKGFLAE